MKVYSPASILNSSHEELGVKESALPGVRLAESLGSGFPKVADDGVELVSARVADDGEDPARATAPYMAPAATAPALAPIAGGH